MLHSEELPVHDVSKRWNCEDVAQQAFDDRGKEVGNKDSVKPHLITPAELSDHVKFYSHQLMHFFIQLCISLLSYIKIT